MTWKSDGSLAERMRALRQRDDLSLLKQDASMGALGQMGVEGLSNVQPVQEQAAAAIPGLGGPPKSDAARAFDLVRNSFTEMKGKVIELERMLNTQAAHNVDSQKLSRLQEGMMVFLQDIQGLKEQWEALGVTFNDLFAMDASQMAQGGPMQ